MTDAFYNLPVIDTIKTAWHKIYGVKATFWGALILVFAISIILGLLTPTVLETSSQKLMSLLIIICKIFVALLQFGLVYMGIKRAKDLPISFNDLFHPFERWIFLKLFLAYLLIILILLVPVILFGITYAFFGTNFISVIVSIIGIILALVFIYLSIRLMMTFPFVLDQEVGPVTAVKLSFKATKSNFWPVLALIILQALIVCVLAIPLGIGLIWGIPFYFVNYGLMYHRLATNNIKA